MSSSIPHKPLCFAVNRGFAAFWRSRPLTRTCMRRTLAFLPVLLALITGDLHSQAPTHVLVPKGYVSVLFNPSFDNWNSRFGKRLEGGILVEEEEPLGLDLTDQAGTSLFPSIGKLEEQIRALTGDPSYSGILGAADGLVVHDVTRIDMGAHVGVLDWLTLGVVAPLVKNRTVFEMNFRPDSLNSDLGLNPRISNDAQVTGFLDALESAYSSVQAHANAVCTDSSGSAACAHAESLAERLQTFRSATEEAYSSSSFFPLHGSAIATSLSNALAALDYEMVSIGLNSIGSNLVFATDWLTEAALFALPTTNGIGIEGSPLQDIPGIWELGDIEVSALVRLLDGGRPSLGEPPPFLRYGLMGSVLVRLGTGKVDAHNIFLDLATGDGQTDIEAGISGFLGIGSRMGIRSSARYGLQMPTTLMRRVAPPEIVMPLAATLREVQWSPASYMRLEVEPSWNFSPQLYGFGTYHFYSKAMDSYELTGNQNQNIATQVASVFVEDLQDESSRTFHQLGVGLRYSTLNALGSASEQRPAELHGRVIYTLAGSGGHTPITTRVEFGIRLFQRFWGGVS